MLPHRSADPGGPRVDTSALAGGDPQGYFLALDTAVVATNQGESTEVPIDRVTRFRRLILPKLHRLKARFGGYAQCPMHPSEYVGTVKRTLRQFRVDLRRMGFRPEPISSLKCHGDGRLSAGSWVRRRSWRSEQQLHVTLFVDGRGFVDVFAHREYSWLTHPYRHYTADEWDPAGGVDRMRMLLDAHDVLYRAD